MNKNPIVPTVQYFEILRALHKGGLSLWLNRKALMPMAFIPVVVTFLTLALTRGEGFSEISPFTLALIQMPADFVTGIFCALIIVIIMNAPKKGDSDAPIMFSLNIMDKKHVMIAGAIAHVVFGYLTIGLYGVMDLLAAPMKAAADAGTPPTLDKMVLLLVLLAIGFYAVRFMMLPILIVADMDIKEFFAHYKGVGLSAPIFLVKAGTVFGLGLVMYLPLGLLMAGANGETISVIQMGLMDFATALGSVFATAWAYASLSIGMRQMLGK
jgi:hypothetical protein